MSIPEILIATVIGISAIGLIVGLAKPMLSAQDAQQASMAEIQVMGSTLYRLQRDVRQSDPNGIFLCTSVSQSVGCVQASTYADLTDVSYFAVLTAQKNGTGPTRWDSTGRPSWSGFNVYWLAPDGNGTNTMYFAFGSARISCSRSQNRCALGDSGRSHLAMVGVQAT